MHSAISMPNSTKENFKWLESTRGVAVFVFALALIVRLAMLAGAQHDPSSTADSAIYIGIGEGIAATGDFVRQYADHVEPVTERVPAYPALLAASFRILGNNLQWPLLLQCFIDALTCVLIGLIAREISPRHHLVAGLLAVLNLNMAIHTTLILTDTLFLFFFTASLYAAIKHIQRPALSTVMIACTALALGVLTRPLLYYFMPFFLFLIGGALWWYGYSAKRIFTSVGVGCLVLVVLIGPLLMRNYNEYGYAQLVSQGGAGAMEWYVPLTFQYAIGESTDTVIQRERVKLNERLDATADPVLRNNPFFVSQQQIAVAKEELSKLTLGQIAYAWTGGALLNIFAPSVTSWPALVQMKRPRFFETEGRNFVDKAINFLSHPDNRFYLAVMVPAILLTLVTRVVALFGLVVLAAKSEAGRRALWVLLPSSLFIVAITGPLVSAARYRLPIEPLIIVLLAVGLVWLYDTFAGRRSAI